MGKDSGASLRELIISFGFLEGIWIALGIDPQDEVIAYFAEVFNPSDPWIALLFRILPSLLFLVTMYFVYRMGGVIGLTAIFIAFIAGLAVVYSPLLTGLLIILAMAIGKLAKKPKRKMVIV